jgi:hypothetical protein
MSFDTFDEDGSGSLEASEIKAILTRMSGGAALTDEDADEFIKEFDRDGDGMIDFNEFIIAMGVMSDAVDTDGDGTIDSKQDGVDQSGSYEGREEDFAQKLAEGENIQVANLKHGNIHDSVEGARRVQAA